MEKKAYFVWAHPKQDSLTAQIVESMKKHAKEKGFTISELDLYRSDFDPSLKEVDLPFWKDGNDYINGNEQNFSQEVYDMFNELKGVDTVFVVFPIWWNSFPALLKGYIDRVWNFGLAYGYGNKLPVNRIRWIALGGGTESLYKQYELDKYIRHFMDTGLAIYCGIEDSSVEILYNTIGFEEEGKGADHYEKLFKQANAVIDNLN